MREGLYMKRDLAAVTGLPLTHLEGAQVWLCSDCGCSFLPAWDGDRLYPDRHIFAPTCAEDPGDGHDCPCHAVPREVRLPPIEEIEDVLTDYAAWAEEGKKLNAAEDDPDVPSPGDDWWDHDQDGLAILDRLVTAILAVRP